MRKTKNYEPVQQNPEELLEELLDYYTTSKMNVLMKMRKNIIPPEEFLQDAEKHLREYYHPSPETVAEVLASFENFVFGYAVLTPLIDDPDISDIRCVGAKDIRVKRKGQRMSSGVTFKGEKAYKQFIDFVATKNQANISNFHAIQRFTDTTSNPDYILRFTVIMPLLSTYDSPYLAIRKVPRNFPELDDLVQEKVLPAALAKELQKRFRESSTLICGGNSSGKTTLLNALKETLPKNMSVMVTQQADELTTKSHPDMMFTHSLPGNAESAISYDLKDLSIAGLTMDIDFFIIGEVKGDEALYLLNAAYSGQLCAATIHCPAADKAADKVVDYAFAAGSKYNKAEMLKMMTCFKTIVFMQDYTVQEVKEIVGWDSEKGELLYKVIYEKGGKRRADTGKSVDDYC